MNYTRVTACVGMFQEREAPWGWPLVSRSVIVRGAAITTGRRATLPRGRHGRGKRVARGDVLSGAGCVRRLFMASPLVAFSVSVK
ncbi:hypothetical protein E2C01_050349 [Portunus trituberculatus]|uniref:Uncharacterized protein n=1 Tax=Portunus trituberculatus TaxID=210409 RepID=A0A5B7GFV2_PORTR|nr:hypothetical protein [Portunus trituberculatus]